MKCQRCNERDARVHLTEIKNGQKNEIDLCEVCAKEMKLVGPLEAAIPPEAQKVRCPGCGITLKDFIASGRLGCEECYAAFAEQLEELHLKTHSAKKHKGKVPVRLNGPDRKKRMLEYLTQELERAVKKENFEQAAALRDQIAGLEAGDAADK
ncbi:MAG TPA: hypothetical protein ENN09_00360 [Planctomycetes bacterium]|nr:hypothetical protein [Planctomycetota bacterium]